MSAAKTEAIRLIEASPDGAGWLDLAYRVYVRAKVEQGLAEVDAGRSIPNAEVMREMEEWLASVGHPPPATTSNGA